MDKHKEFKLANRSVLKEFHQIYIKHNGTIPLVIFRDFLDQTKNVNQNLLIEVLTKDGMINFTNEEIFNLDDFQTDDEEIVIIDDIDVTEEMNFSSKNEIEKIFVKKIFSIDDEVDFFNYISRQVSENELEYFSVHELVNVLLSSIAYTKTEEVKRIIELLIQVIEDSY